LVRDAALLVALAALVAVQPGNWENLATDAALLSFCAVGTTLVILAGGIDISLGALMALSAGVAGWLWEHGSPWPAVAAVAIAIGAAGGFLNAALSLLGRVHPIVVTLGTMSLYRGLLLWWIGRIGQDVQVAGSARDWLFERAAGLSPAVWLGLVMVVTVWLLLNGTVSGRELYALGSNPAAARRVGISLTRGWLKAFTLQGALLGLAGFLYLARGGNVQPNSFDEKTLEAIAAAVVGGVAIVGGRGSVWGVLLGCGFLVALAPACLFLGIPTYWQQTLVGSVLVFAVTADALWRRRSA
jgi:rhamnose transport system permease protein